MSSETTPDPGSLQPDRMLAVTFWLVLTVDVVALALLISSRFSS